MEIKDLIIKNQFHYNKALGQNFITDKNLLDAIADDAGITSDDIVVEIGTGAGTLTTSLAKKAKKVITFEVDKNLSDILSEVFSDKSNIELHFADVLDMKDEELRKWVPEKFKVVANLPYYITTPLMMRFLESSFAVESLTLMMQKEVALRMTAKYGTSDYGAITVAVDVFGDAKITRNIPKTMFFPQPKIDSALLKIDRVINKYSIADESLFKKTVKAAFMWRRKTLANCLSSAFCISKEASEKVLSSCGFDIMIRGEKLSTSDFVMLSEKLKAEDKND